MERAMVEEPLVENETEFWERRHDLTPQTTTDADIRERAANGRRHLVLLANITDGTVLSQFESALTALERFDCIAPVPLRYLHVTVKVVGNVVEKPESEAELTSKQEERIIESARSAFANIEPFTVEFPQFNLFPSVVYAEVRDGGRFSELNRRACNIPDIPVWNRDGERFIPHVTLGQFTHGEEYEQLLSHLEANRRIVINPIEVSGIELVSLDLAERFPAFETLETFDLG
jgi:2'-5' RNA ligase